MSKKRIQERYFDTVIEHALNAGNKKSEASTLRFRHSQFFLKTEPIE